MVLVAAPNRYNAAADLILDLPRLTADARKRLGITAKTQAAQIGIATDTLTRLESGSVPTQTTIVSTLRWLARN